MNRFLLDKILDVSTKPDQAQGAHEKRNNSGINSLFSFLHWT